MEEMATKLCRKMMKSVYGMLLKDIYSIEVKTVNDTEYDVTAVVNDDVCASLWTAVRPKKYSKYKLVWGENSYKSVEKSDWVYKAPTSAVEVNTKLYLE
ncbi:MAG: hypothetical protein HUJ68_10760 [Clostridia bacterium]|nr:hypothetical protein [Clostridia bacterium]